MPSGSAGTQRSSLGHRHSRSKRTTTSWLDSSKASRNWDTTTWSAGGPPAVEQSSNPSPRAFSPEPRGRSPRSGLVAQTGEGLEGEHHLHRHVEVLGDAQGQMEAGTVFTPLQVADRL